MRLHKHMEEGHRTVITDGSDFDCWPERGCWFNVPDDLCMCNTIEDGWRPCPANLCERTDSEHAQASHWQAGEHTPEANPKQT